MGNRAGAKWVFSTSRRYAGLDAKNDPLVRGIGLVRARARIGLKNLAYNMRRLVQLELARRPQTRQPPSVKPELKPIRRRLERGLPQDP